MSAPFSWHCFCFFIVCLSNFHSRSWKQRTCCTSSRNMLQTGRYLVSGMCLWYACMCACDWCVGVICDIRACFLVWQKIHDRILEAPVSIRHRDDVSQFAHLSDYIHCPNHPWFTTLQPIPLLCKKLSVQWVFCISTYLKKCMCPPDVSVTCSAQHVHQHDAINMWC